MLDVRVERLANVLLNYSLKVKKGDIFLITGDIKALPLIKEVYKRAIKNGAYPRVLLHSDDLDEVYFREASDKQLAYLSKISLYEARNTDCFLSIMGSSNTRYLTSIDPAKQVLVRRARKPISDIILKKNRWTVTLFPTDAYAQEADMSLAEFENFVFSACFCDKSKPIDYWGKLADYQEKLIKKLKNVKEIRIVGEDTDLKMSVEGRTFINSNGIFNMPSGEIFTGPVENSVEGYIRYTFPACFAGRVVEDIKLEFKKGKVVKASADKGEDFLHKMLSIDRGARFVGELGIGTNKGIQKFIKNILFDEKIGGTVHLALGKGYPETGSKNKSALHWDMIKDLRKGGTIYADGKVFMRNGKFKA